MMLVPPSWDVKLLIAAALGHDRQCARGCDDGGEPPRDPLGDATRRPDVLWVAAGPLDMREYGACLARREIQLDGVDAGSQRRELGDKLRFERGVVGHGAGSSTAIPSTSSSCPAFRSVPPQTTSLVWPLPSVFWPVSLQALRSIASNILRWSA